MVCVVCDPLHPLTGLTGQFVQGSLCYVSVASLVGVQLRVFPLRTSGLFVNVSSTKGFSGMKMPPLWKYLFNLGFLVCRNGLFGNIC